MEDKIGSAILERLAILDARLINIQETISFMKGDIARNSQRLERMEKRLDRLEERFDQLEGRLDHLEERFDLFEKRSEQFATKDEMNRGFEEINKRFDALEAKYAQIAQFAKGLQYIARGFSEFSMIPFEGVDITLYPKEVGEKI